MRSGCRQGARTQVRSYLRRIRTWTWTCESRTKLVLSTLPWAVALCRRHLTALARRRRTGPCSLLAAVCMYVASRPGKLLAPMHVRQADGIRRRAVPCSTNKLKLWLGCCVCCLCYVAVRRQARDVIWTKERDCTQTWQPFAAAGKRSRRWLGICLLDRGRSRPGHGLGTPRICLHLA